eukprot:1412481-Rhodomonas_salina.1
MLSLLRRRVRFTASSLRLCLRLRAPSRYPSALTLPPRRGQVRRGGGGLAERAVRGAGRAAPRPDGHRQRLLPRLPCLAPPRLDQRPPPLRPLQHHHQRQVSVDDDGASLRAATDARLPLSSGLRGHSCQTDAHSHICAVTLSVSGGCAGGGGGSAASFWTRAA